VLLRKPDGGVQFDFHGKLSFSWPRRADQYANNAGQAGYDPLFPLGFGLTYGDKGALPALSEDPGIDPDAARTNLWFDKGVPTTGATLRLVGADGGAMDIVHPHAATSDGSVAMEAINTDIQEGARRFAFKGAGAVELRSNAPVDLVRETNGDVFVVATLRVDALPAGAKASIGAGCGSGCQGEVAIGDALATLPTGEWTRLGVQLKCLRVAGADTGKLDMPFVLRGSDGLQLALSKVTASTDFDRKVECPVR
jgi:beta-glucosidase